jgi:hypothetical protein
MIADLRPLLRSGAEMLREDCTIADPLAVLGAFAVCESSFGKNTKPRYEKNYAFKGKYFDFFQQQRYAVWGAWGACSYGWGQILYPTACELGFDTSPYNRSPGELWVPDTCLLFVVAYIKRRIIHAGASKLKDFPDAYNSGNCRDEIVPEEYCERWLKAYDTVIEDFKLREVPNA